MTGFRHRAFAISVLLPLAFLSINRLAFSQAAVANYVIDARLDASLHTIEGSEVVTWHNFTGQVAGVVEFHMFANAFRSELTTFMRESGGTIAPGERGWIDLVGITDLKTGEDLLGRSRYIQPDDQNPYDSTVLSVQLPEPVSPQDSVVLKIGFLEQLPEAAYGYGWSPGGRYYLAAHWFPKVGVFENGRWHCPEFGIAEDYSSSFDSYRVNLSLPLDYIVGATGVRTDDQTEAGRTVRYSYSADSVRDFVWAASPHFELRKHKFNYAGLPETTVILLLQRNHLGQAGRYLAAADSALAFFVTHYGRYPYPDLTIVDVPRTMESVSFRDGNAGLLDAAYPALIAAGSGDYSLRHYLEPETAIARGMAGQYWSGVAAASDSGGAWLDSGLSSFSAGRFLEQDYGPDVSVYKIAGVYPVYAYPVWELGGYPAAALLGKVRIKSPYEFLPVYLRHANTDAVSVADCGSENEIGREASTMAKSALAVSTLEGVLGGQVMDKALRSYYQRFRFKHHTIHDFEKVCREVSGSDLDWFFNQLVRGSGTVDFGVESISYFRRTDLSSGASTFITEVTVVRKGDVKMPVDLRLTLADDNSIDTVWDGKPRRQVFRFETASAPFSAEVDPFQKIPIDINYSNNSLLVQPDFLPVLKWVNSLLNYFQNILLTVGVLV